MSEPKVGDVESYDRGGDSVAWRVFVGADANNPSSWAWGLSEHMAKRIGAELSAAREMREVLREVEWSGFSQYSSGRWVDPVSGRVFDDPPQNLRACPRCYGLQPEQPFLPPPGIFRIGHAPDCRLARLIGGGE